MNLLFDHNVPRQLRRHLEPHRVALTKEMHWEDMENGALLAEAQAEFEVIITTDTNIKYQNQLPQFDLAMVVLRGYSNAYRELVALAPELLTTLETIESGQIVYLYVAEALRQSDQRKGKG